MTQVSTTHFDEVEVFSQVLIFFITHKSDTAGFRKRDPTRFLGIAISIISAFYNHRGASHSISTVSKSPRSTLNPTQQFIDQKQKLLTILQDSRDYNHIRDVRSMY